MTPEILFRCKENVVMTIDGLLKICSSCGRALKLQCFPFSQYHVWQRKAFCNDCLKDLPLETLIEIEKK